MPAMNKAPVNYLSSYSPNLQQQAQALLDQAELDLVAIGKAALANHDWPQRVRDGAPMNEFDFAMFLPMATITNELAWRGTHDSR